MDPILKALDDLLPDDLSDEQQNELWGKVNVATETYLVSSPMPFKNNDPHVQELGDVLYDISQNKDQVTARLLNKRFVRACSRYLASERRKIFDKNLISLYVTVETMRKEGLPLADLLKEIRVVEDRLQQLNRTIS